MSRNVDRHLRGAPPTATSRTWAGVFAGPLAWFASQQVTYALVPWACHGGTLLALHATNLIALTVVVVAGALAWRAGPGAGQPFSDEAGPPEGRQRFLGMLGPMLCLLFGLVIVAQTIGVFFFGPCQR